jgi:hypothetical protein
MPSIVNTLNRFSSATMNQLYHPQRTADFFAFLAQHHVPTYTVTNNAVGDLSTFSDPDKKIRSFTGIVSFLSSNGLCYDFLKNLAVTYYESRYTPPRKPFDFYVALALCTKLRDDSSGITNCLRQTSCLLTESLEIARAHGCRVEGPGWLWAD